jgi:hypothetical protein
VYIREPDERHLPVLLLDVAMLGSIKGLWKTKSIICVRSNPLLTLFSPVFA